MGSFENFGEKFMHFFSRYPIAGILIDRILRVLVIIAVVFICAKLIHLVCNHILKIAHRVNEHNKQSLEREKRVATVVKLVDTSLRVFLYGAAFLMGLREFGVDITPLLTGAGIAGVAVGFGAQSLVKDVISGFFILIEDQIRVGDVIKINNGLSGAVERMEMRVTAIRDGDGTLHIIPNGEIKSVSNMTYDFAQAVVSVHLPYRIDLRKVNQILERVSLELEEDPRWKSHLRNRPEFLGITDLQPGHMTLQIVAKTEPHSRWSVTREFRKRVILAFESEGIVPFQELSSS